MNRTLWFAVAALVTGIAFATGIYLGRSGATATYASNHAIFETGGLNGLYTGNTNRAAQYLEWMLDDDTYAMAKMRGRILSPAERHQLNNVISRVVRFRRLHPRKAFPVPREDWQHTDSKEWRDFVHAQSSKIQAANATVDNLLQEQE
jgi:hypothetical protein